MNSFKLYNINVFPGYLEFYNCGEPYGGHPRSSHLYHKSTLWQETGEKYLSNYWTEFVCIDDWEAQLPENSKISKIVIHIPVSKHSRTVDSYELDIRPKRDSKNGVIAKCDKRDELEFVFDSEQGLREFKGSLSITLEKFRPKWDIDNGAFAYCYFPGTLKNAVLWYYVNSEKRPYFEFFYEFKAPNKPEGLSPKSDTINPRGDILFTWNTKTPQQAFELQYKTEETNWVTVRRDTSDRQFKLEANKISKKTGTVDWRVKIKDNSGKWSDWATSYFTLEISKQEPPIILAPKGDYVKSDKPILFEWVFVGAATEKQQAFEIQYTLNGQQWKTVKETTERNNYNLTETKGLISALGKWKIKVTNNFGETSEFSEEATFQIIGTPIPPQILEVTDNNFPNVRWNTKEQESYYLEILDSKENLIYSSGLVVGYKQEHRVKKFLETGGYTLRLKTVNLYGLESEVMNFTFSISDKQIKAPSINLFKSNYFIKISSDTKDGVVERNGEIVGKLSDGEYFDYTIANDKRYAYRIIKVENNNGANSKTKGTSTHFSGNTIANLSNLSEFLILKWNLDNAPERSINYEAEKSEIEIIGRDYPFIEFGSIKKEEFGYSFIINAEELDRLRTINFTKEEVLFRDYYGRNVVGVLDALSIRKLKVNKYQVSFKITRTRIKYE